MTSLDEPLFQRRLVAVLHQRMTEELVVAIHGPRSAGKSTVLGEFADSRDVPVVDFDDSEVREAAARNPRAIADGAVPICIDEYQRVPLILDALKTRLNAGMIRAGLAALTGSTRQDALPRAAQSLTGRLHVLSLLPLSQGEIDGSFENFLAVLLAEPERAIAAHPTSITTRLEYVQRVTTGGFPLVLLRRTDAARMRWFDDYITQSVERDAVELARIRERQVLRKVLERITGQSAQLLNIARICDGLGADRKTVESYVRLLEDLYLVQRLEAWGTTLRSRARKQPKIHVVDSGLAARLLRLTPNRLVGVDPASLTEFGHLLETFAMGELRKQASWVDEPLALGHWRTDVGAEVDLVVETADGSVVAFEIKANQSVPATDLRGLRTLRDALGSRFIAGVALSLGTRSYTFEDRIHVCPVDRLWQTV